MYENVNKKLICVVIKESCIYFYTDMANLLKFSFFKKSCFDSKSNENIWKIGLNCSSCYKHVLLFFFLGKMKFSMDTKEGCTSLVKGEV